MPVDILSGFQMNQQSDPSKLTESQKIGLAASQIADALTQGSQQVIRTLIDNRNRMFNAFWNTPNVHPKYVVAALSNKGISVISLFKHDTELVTFIEARAKEAGVTLPDNALSQKPDRFVVTVAADGIVAIDDAPVPL